MIEDDFLPIFPQMHVRNLNFRAKIALNEGHIFGVKIQIFLLKLIKSMKDAAIKNS